MRLVLVSPRAGQALLPAHAANRLVTVYSVEESSGLPLRHCR